LLSGSTGLLGLVDKTSASKDWAQFYGTGLGYKDAYVLQSSTFTLVWKVTNAQGAPIAGQQVWLQANKGYGGSTATFTSGSYVITNTTGANDGALIPGITDSQGNVSFTLTNTSATGEPSATPPSGIDTLNAANGAIYGQFGLRIGAIAQISQSMDIVDVHVISSGVTPSPTPTASPSPSPTAIPSAVIWSQEFNDAAGTKPDSHYWTPLIGDGSSIGLYRYGTGEIEINTADAAAQDGNGNLVITSQKSNGTWTSSRLWTQNKINFQYGKIEARIKMPTGRGPWPAFWMLGSNYMPPVPPAGSNFGKVSWPNSGEIDIAEVLGGSTTTSQGTIHGNDPGTFSDWKGGAGYTGYTPNNFDLTADFHTYGMLWTPSGITFTFDGVAFANNTKANITAQTGGVWPFDQPFFLILNVAINQSYLDPNLTSTKMYVDWIRYSSYNGTGAIK
jgi:beta-glucanase (GH16 family)